MTELDAEDMKLYGSSRMFLSGLGKGEIKESEEFTTFNDAKRLHTRLRMFINRRVEFSEFHVAVRKLRDDAWKLYVKRGEFADDDLKWYRRSLSREMLSSLGKGQSISAEFTAFYDAKKTHTRLRNFILRNQEFSDCSVTMRKTGPKTWMIHVKRS